MRTLLLAAVATLFTANAFAATCDEMSAEKKLAGAAKSSFMKKCEAEGRGTGTSGCEAKAADKKLAGAAKTSFLKKCEADAKGDAPAADSGCAAKSAEKKLAGAAKTSFMKKCEADAKGDAKPEAKAEPKKADAKK
jgi:hypothetical protein